MKELAIGEKGIVDCVLVKCVMYDGDCTPCAFAQRPCSLRLCGGSFRKDGNSVMFTPVDSCTWTQVADGIWHTSCGQAHEFNTGTPEENDHQYCQYCGKVLDVSR